MRFFIYFVAALFPIRTALAISNNATFITEQMSLIPQCSLSCLLPAIPEFGCTMTDINCICTNTKLSEEVAGCSLDKCGLTDSLMLSKITANICEPPPQSQAKTIEIVNITTGVISRVAVILRLASRFWLQHRWLPDDWIIFAALLIESACLYFRVTLVKGGLGRHIWTVDLSQLGDLLRAMYGAEIVYVAVNGLVKLSLLTFYLQLFPSKRFKIVAWTTIAFCICSTVSFVLVTFFQCSPVSLAWNKQQAGHCVNYNAVTWAHAGINVIQELLIFVMPLWQLRHLKLDSFKKLGLLAVFCVGGFTCITSAIRMYTLRHYGLTSDPTWDNSAGIIWSTLEISAGMVCASMPALRAGFRGIATTVSTYTATSPEKSSQGSSHHNKSESFSEKHNTSISKGSFGEGTLAYPESVHSAARENDANLGIWRLVSIDQTSMKRTSCFDPSDQPGEVVISALPQAMGSREQMVKPAESDDLERQ